MLTEAQKRAKENYRKKVKQILVEFTPNDADILEHLEKQPQKATYIKNLIREDMNK